MEFNNSVNALTQEEWLMIEMDEFLTSKERSLMLNGERYYRTENDILKRKMFRYENELPVEDETKTNNKLAHGFMHTLIEDKVNYLLTKPYTMSCEDETYLKNIQRLLGKRFQKKLARLGTECSNKGISWLHPYVSSKGDFKMIMIPSEQCKPIWSDNDHEELEGMIRIYDVEVYEGKQRTYVTKVEYYTADGVTYYEKHDNQLIIDAQMYFEAADDNPNELGHFNAEEEQQSWGKVPFIPFKNNDFELPDLQFVKTLVDNYDITRSDIANLLEDIKNVIYVLKGYGGENLGHLELLDFQLILLASVDPSLSFNVESTSIVALALLSFSVAASTFAGAIRAMHKQHKVNRDNNRFSYNPPICNRKIITYIVGIFKNIVVS